MPTHPDDCRQHDYGYAVSCSQSLGISALVTTVYSLTWVLVLFCVNVSRLYVLVAWLQAVVQERLRYVPLGWSKR